MEMGLRSKAAVIAASFAVTMFVAAPAALAAKPANQPTMQFKSGGYGVNENVSPVQLAVERKPKGSSTVHFNTDGGTATGGSSCANAGVDFVAVADALVTFSDQALVTVPVTICNDVVDEPNETVIVQLSNPSSGTSLTNKRQATVTITDNDAAPSLTLHDASVDEGDGGHMSVTLSAASSLPVSFMWSTADGTATTADGDYESQGGSVAIPPGQLGASFALSTEPDIDDEDDETFTVSLSNLINASVADGTGTMTIVDDDVFVDTTAPTSLSATILDNDDDGFFSVGDVYTVVFDEPMNTAPLTDFDDYIYYNNNERLNVGEGDYVWLDSTTLQVSIVSTSACPFLCELGNDLTSVTADFIEDVAGNDWALGGDVTLEDPPPTGDVVAPTSVSATIANDSDDALSAGDVITIVFDEPMNTATFPLITYNGGEQITGDEADYVWLDAITLRITINSTSFCPNVLCALGNDITSADPDSVEDLAGNDWPASGDVTLEDAPSPPGDTTAPASVSATIVDTDNDGRFSAGDVVTINFDEAMNTVISPDAIEYNGGEFLRADEATFVWLASTRLQITVDSPSFCPSDVSCALGGFITANINGWIQDLAGNVWALAGDVTLEDPSP
jgi:hypothetical protein